MEVCSTEALEHVVAAATAKRGCAATQLDALATVCAFLPLDAPTTQKERDCCRAAFSCLPWGLVALKDHGAGDAALCERALFLLRRVCSHVVQGETASAALGGQVVAAVLAALEAHPTVPAVAAQALGCLTNLGLTEFLSEALIALVPTVLAAVERHAGHVIVVRPGSRFLLNCSSRRVHREVLVPAVGRLLAVVGHHWDNVATLLGCLGFLNNLALAGGGSFTQGPDAPAYAVAPWALRALLVHPSKSELVDTAASALWHAQLAVGPRPLLSLPLLPTLLEVLKLHSEQRRVAFTGVKLLTPLVPDMEDVDSVLAVVVLLRGVHSRQHSDLMEALLTQQGILEARWSAMRRAWCGAVAVSTLRRHSVRR